MIYPRVLVISNNSFSKTSSNGRTLGNFFQGWSKDCLAQFCVSTVVPDYDLCDNYYLITDKSAFDGFCHFRKANRCDIEKSEKTEGNTVIGGKRLTKTPWLALLRSMVWSNRRWKSKDFLKWVEDFNPEVVLVMNTDAPFLLDLAVDVSKMRSIPLAIFNTEGYYLFKKSYYRRSRCFSDGLFKVYQWIYRRHFRKAMEQVSLSIYCNSLLRDDYVNEFGGNSIVLYTGSSLDFDISNLHVDKPTFSYLGNFGFDRPDALIEVAEVLQSIDSSYRLNVYGKIPRPEIERQFEECPGIEYKGMLSYEDVVKVMYDSTILFHAEVQGETFRESLRYGFTTKIADSISCGHPFLMYSSPEIAGAKYILETGAGWHAKNKEELKMAIVSILTDETQRARVLEKAKETAIENHKMDTTTRKFREALNSLVSDKEQ